MVRVYGTAPGSPVSGLGPDVATRPRIERNPFDALARPTGPRGARRTGRVPLTLVLERDAIPHA